MTAIMRAAYACAVLVALAGCAATPPPPREVTVVKEVPVPYHQPCPAPTDKPAAPAPLAKDRPVMPAEGTERERLMAAKLLEYRSYADKADAVMDACAR